MAVTPVVHMCPEGDEPQFPCCGGWPLERLGDRMTLDPAQVTCSIRKPSMDIISAIDAATGCQHCGNPLGSSPSSDFCSEFCQATWHEKRVGILRVTPLIDTSGIIVNPSVHGFAEHMNAAARTARSLSGLIYGSPSILVALRERQDEPGLMEWDVPASTSPAAEGL